MALPNRSEKGYTMSKYDWIVNMFPGQEYITAEKARIAIKCAKSTIRYYIKSGLLPCQTGTNSRSWKYFIRPVDLKEMMEDRDMHPEKYKLPKDPRK